MKNNLKYCLISTCMALLTIGARANEVVDVIPLPERPVIDGVIDYDLWGRDGWHSDFRSIRDRALAARGTRFKVGVDESHLFFAVKADKPGIGDEPPSRTEAGGPVWSDECVEFFIAPTGADGPVFQIVINAWGTPFFHEIGGPEWTPELEIGAVQDANHYTVELAVPLDAFGVPLPVVTGTSEASVMERTIGANGTLEAFAYTQKDSETGVPLSWRFNIGRHSGHHWSFSPFHGSFNQPEKFAALSFAGAGKPRLILDPASENLSRTDALRFEKTVPCRNDDTQPRHIVLRAGLEDQASPPEWTAELTPGAEHRFDVVLPLTAFGEQVIRLELLEADGDRARRTVQVDRLAREFRHVPLAISLQLPYARNVVYNSGPPERLRTNIRLAPGDADQIGRRLVVELRDPAGERTAAREVDLKKMQQEIALPLPPLTPGIHTLEVWSKPDGLSVLENQLTLHVLPPAEHEWRVADDGGVTYNGQPLFIRGHVSGASRRAAMAVSSAELRALAAQREVNLHIAPGSRYLTGRRLQAFLDRHRASGVYILCSPFAGDMDRRAEPLSEREETAIRERVRELREHDMLMGYLLADNPSDRLAVRERLQRIAQIVWEEDPYRLLVTSHDSVPGFRALDGVADVRILNPALLRSDDGETVSLKHIQTALQTATAAGRPAFWVGVGLPGRDPRDPLAPSDLASDAIERIIATGMQYGAGGACLAH